MVLIDKKAAKDILDEVLTLMSKELNWDELKIKEEKKEALTILNSYI